ncbi:calcium/sodium antiporter [Methylomonas sp. EFPC3]|uniref:calcium/sodium antiporter n=1 Tax=Methylomonas sp. EFPC3 TaxID=3021710 RepID=UPI002416FE45|nr:calcium/sodium antiporter [Methylomonas sp. EFPC3]WFP49521.1 calcium/sodium antiporter [Methylomonas sp. EFPC3]
MALPLLMIVIGLVVLVWSADIFVEGAAAIARFLGMSPLLIGMVVIGFGTSAPELTVSALSAWQGNPGIALGNAYGSNITNIALILGTVALISPIVVHSQIIKKELPVLMGVTVFAFGQLYDGSLSRTDAILELTVFVGVMTWMVRQGLKQKVDVLADEVAEELAEHTMSFAQATIWLVSGLLLLMISSRLLVWGAVTIAQNLGVSDLIIGLTIVAIGTSLPELASSIAAARKGEHDLALGNIIGSNLFNTLAVVGLAGAIHPMSIPVEIVNRDWPLMALLTASLFALGYAGKREQGRINRVEGGVLLAVYAAYTLYLIDTVVSG